MRLRHGPEIRQQKVICLAERSREPRAAHRRMMEDCFDVDEPGIAPVAGAKPYPVRIAGYRLAIKEGQSGDRLPFRPSHFLKCGICCLAFLGISATPAHAYLDPGTGSIILQGLIASLAAAAAYLSIFGFRVKTFLKRFRVPRMGTGKDAENN